MSIVIAIDGPSGAGKGALSNALREKYNFSFLDTGLLFRATALKATQKGVSIDNKLSLVNVAQSLEESDFISINQLRSEDNGQAASSIAVIPEVRSALVAYIKDFVKKQKDETGGAILDGRDIGSIICPDADVKFFITANSEERAKRRLKELQNRGIKVMFEEVLQEMIQRDRRDCERKDSPLVAADDAIVIDTSDMTIADVVNSAVKAVDKALARS